MIKLCLGKVIPDFDHLTNKKNLDFAYLNFKVCFTLSAIYRGL